MKTLKKSKVRNANNVIEILKVKELLKIRGGEEQSSGNGTLKEIDID